MSLLEPQPQVDIEFDEGEEPRYIGRRHWIELLQTGSIFLLLAIVLGGLALYRAVGGTFFTVRLGEEVPLTDPLNLFLLVLAALMGLLWLRGSRQPRSRRSPAIDPRALSLLYLIAAGVLLVAVWFRTQGGQILAIDPLEARPADAWNLLLMVGALLAFGFFVYLYIDWKDDFFVVTNRRVVYDDRQLFVRHIQQQVLIEDIQQVNTVIDSYPAVWFGYGRLVIRSFSTRTLTFLFANRPKEIEAAIMAEVGQLRRAREPDVLRQLIEDQVYGKTPPPQPGPAIRVQVQEGPIAWLFPANPEIRGDTVTWRPSWVFMALALARPTLGFLLVAAALVMLATIGAIGAEIALVVGAVALLVFGGWFYWIREELINDVYVLNRQTIIDVDRRPFGPESVRRAQLGAIQDISFDVSFIESLLGFGTVVITTGGAGGGRFTFNHVPDPRGVQATINDYLTDFRKHERERQLQDAVQLIKQYDAVQRDRGEKLSREGLDELIAARAEELLERKLPPLVEREVRSAQRGRLALNGQLAHLRRLRRRPPGGP
ncbi:MAG TPA: PH domain-containing protein [Roseiflexaceae bacterium]|nr:PH domain-containing protein [Roseiflexaceae bacterium]